MKKLGKTASAISAALLIGAPAGAVAQGQEQGQQEGQQQGQQGQQGQQEGQQGQQGQQQQGQQEGQQGQQQGQQGQQGQDVAVQATARGVITDISYTEGVVRLSTGDGTQVFRAMPNQIAQLRTGEQFTARWANFGGDRWLVENMQAQGQGRQFGRSGQLTGNIVALDKNEGTFTLSTTAGQAGQQQQQQDGQQQDQSGTIQLQSHPALIEDLLPNQYVQVQFQRVGDNTWAQQIQPAQQQQSGQQ